MKTKNVTEKNMKVCLVGSSGGHLTHLYMLKPFWKDKNHFWVTFDKEDARSLLEGEKMYPCYYPTNRSIKALMDNMKSHHAKAVRNLLDSSGVRYIYLPPYSPDLNPIEKLWSKVKSFLRKFKARTLDALPNAIQCAFQTVSPSDCSGWFHSCGYSPYF